MMARHRWRAAIVTTAGIAGAALLGAQALRFTDQRDAAAAWETLAALAQRDPAAFDLAMIEGLPEPAQRYFRFAIAPGTPLKRVALIEMTGRFGLGDKAEHQFYPMRARQILAPPHGFVWAPRIGAGMMRMSGSDALVEGRAWTRFWLLGTIPLVRTAGTRDLARSAAGRLIGEAFWAPATLLPGEGVQWEPVNNDTARAVFSIDGERHAVDLTVGPDGRPLNVVLQRWSDANQQKVFRWQPFGAAFEQFGTFEGFTVPTRVLGGNLFGTPDHFPFFQAEVTRLDYR